MLANNEFYAPHLEWESIAFPLVLYTPQFEDSVYQFDGPATLTVWRDANLQLKATIQCRMQNLRVLDAEPIQGKANIMRQLSVQAVDGDGHSVVLDGCVLGGYSLKSNDVDDYGYLVYADLIIDTLRVTYSDEKVNAHLEWFLVQDFDAHLYGSTKRSLQMARKKIRLGIDPDDSSERLIGTSHSRDYFVLEHPDINCIVARVPKEFIGKGKVGLCIEFRDNNIRKVTKELLDDIKCLLSVLIGGKLYYMGYSKFSGEILTEVFSDSPEIPLKMPVIMPPIQYNMKYDWGNFALQFNLLFKDYRELQAKLHLNYAVESYWIAQTVPIGANLPILAAAIEIISDAYLKLTSNDQSVYMSQADYEKLIAEELSSLNEKFANIADGTKMLNKIKGAFQKGSNEKLNRFFELLEISIEGPERDAIKLRNKMTHSRRDYSVEETTHDDVISTRVYQALFNRILLKLLGYQGYYKDYSIKNAPLKLI
jgi:hypothetical protein